MTVTNPYLMEVDGQLRRSPAGMLLDAVTKAATLDARKYGLHPSNLFVFASKGAVITVRADAPIELWPS